MNPQSPDNRVTLRRALDLHPFLLLLVLAAAGGAGAAVYFFLPPLKSVAYVIFFINRESYALTALHGETEEGYKTYLQAQINLVMSRQVLNNAVSRPEVKACSVMRREDDPINWLENHLRIDFRSGRAMMKVSLEGDYMDEPELRIIIAAIASSYIGEVMNKV